MLDPWGAPMRADARGRPTTVDPAGNVLVFADDGCPYVVDAADPSGDALLPVYYDADGHLVVGTPPPAANDGSGGDGDGGQDLHGENGTHVADGDDGSGDAAHTHAPGATPAHLDPSPLPPPPWLPSSSLLHGPASAAALAALYPRYRCRVCSFRYARPADLSEHLGGHRAAAAAAGVAATDVEGMRALAWRQQGGGGGGATSGAGGGGGAVAAPAASRGWWCRDDAWGVQ